MHKLSLLLLTVIIATSCAGMQIAGKSIDSERVLQAGGDLITAVTLTDNQVAQLTSQAIADLDSKSRIAAENTEYAKRLARLTRNTQTVNGIRFNFKVYQTNEINAFACADGSVRVYSGLMDAMNDEELMAIIGHEIGHVVNHDTRDAMKNAYYTSAARNAIGSLSGTTIGKLTNSELGDLTSSYLGAQFSQKQEFAADEYGFKISVENGFSPYAMSNALLKLVNLSGGSKASAVAQMFSTHPDSGQRAARMKAKADAYKK